MNKKYSALLLQVILSTVTLLRDFLMLPMPTMLIAALCIVIILLVGTICAICLIAINKKTHSTKNEFPVTDS